MKRDAFSLPLDLGNELIIDNFAGGGGTSEGLEQAFGRPVDIAINHDPEALAMHALNHPYTKHLCESVWDVDPIEVTRNRPVALVWLSPDCKHFSKAKGGTPVSKNIRGLAWVSLRWLLKTAPRAFMLENVEEFVTWGDLIEVAPGIWMPDPSKKGETFRAFIGMISKGIRADHPALAEACEALGIALDSAEAKRLVAGLGYVVAWRELRACDHGTPTIRKRLFIVGRRDGLPIFFPEQTHAEPLSPGVIAGILAPFRTAAECIDFSVEAESIFDRKRPLVFNTERRIVKGAWRYVLTAAKPFIVGVGGRQGQSPERSVTNPAQTITAKADSCVAQPILEAVDGSVLAPFISEHANASNQRNMSAAEPLRTQCAQVKGAHFSVVAPIIAPLRGTDETHLQGKAPVDPLSTISASGTHHALAAVNMITIGYGERPGQDARAQSAENPLGTAVTANKHALVAAHITKFRFDSAGADMRHPMPTATANSFIKRPGGAPPIGITAAHLIPLTHHGERPGSQPAKPMPTVTAAHRGEQALMVACLEQANGGFYDGDGRPADVPVSTITSSGTQQRLVTAYFVKYYSEGGQWSGAAEPAHTLTTKDRVGLVEMMQVPVDLLDPELRDRAKKCADLFHRHLPEHFPEPADMILMGNYVLADITLRMLMPRELFRAQGFPEAYQIEEIPNPKLLFVNGRQV